MVRFTGGQCCRCCRSRLSMINDWWWFLLRLSVCVRRCGCGRRGNVDWFCVCNSKKFEFVLTRVLCVTNGWVLLLNPPSACSLVVLLDWQFGCEADIFSDILSDTQASPIHTPDWCVKRSIHDFRLGDTWTWLPLLCLACTCSGELMHLGCGTNLSETFSEIHHDHRQYQRMSIYNISCRVCRVCHPHSPLALEGKLVRCHTQLDKC